MKSFLFCGTSASSASAPRAPLFLRPTDELASIDKQTTNSTGTFISAVGKFW